MLSRSRYHVPLRASVNCVVVSGKRAGVLRWAACVVLATTRADVNGVLRRRLDVRKASFAPQDEVVELTMMEYAASPAGLARRLAGAARACRFGS